MESGTGVLLPLQISDTSNQRFTGNSRTVAERKANEDRRMVKYFMIGAAIFITILMYACCVAGGEADDREERWFESRSNRC